MAMDGFAEPFNKLQSVMNTVGQDTGIEFPQIAVMGSQSDGKSSVDGSSVDLCLDFKQRAVTGDVGEPSTSEKNPCIDCKSYASPKSDTESSGAYDFVSDLSDVDNERVVTDNHGTGKHLENVENLLDLENIDLHTEGEDMDQDDDDDADEDVVYDEDGTDTLRSDSPFEERMYEVDDGLFEKMERSIRQDNETLSSEQVSSCMMATVLPISQALQLPLPTVRLMFDQFRWNPDNLTEQFFKDKEKILEDTNLKASVWGAFSAMDISGGGRGKLTKVNTEDSCEVCLRDDGQRALKNPSCGHGFCEECWTRYIIRQIVDNRGDKIECLAGGCGTLVEDDFIIKLISDQPEIRTKFHRSITMGFVEWTRCIRWCPHPECLYAIRVPLPECRSVICTACGNSCCFLCGEPWHEPVSCELLQKWKSLCLDDDYSDDNLTLKWLVLNTKECPNCSTTIEKNGGRNDITCIGCLRDFCYVCIQPWDSLLHGQCKEVALEDRLVTNFEDTRRGAYERFLFHLNRFANHQQSLLAGMKLGSTIQATRQKMIPLGISWISSRSLPEAMDILQQSRQTLAYTYVLSYFLVKNKRRDIFEYSQRQMEIAVAALHDAVTLAVGALGNAEEVGRDKLTVENESYRCATLRRGLIDLANKGEGR